MAALATGCVKMKVVFEKKNFDGVGADALIVPCIEKRVPGWAVELQKEASVEKDFDGSKGKSFLLPVPKKPYKRLILLGLGKEDKLKLEDFRLVGGRAYSLVTGKRLEKCALWISDEMELPHGDAAGAFIEGFVLRSLKLDV